MKKIFLLLIGFLFLSGTPASAKLVVKLPVMKVRNLDNRTAYLSDYLASEGITLFCFWNPDERSQIEMISELKETWDAYIGSVPIHVVLVAQDDGNSASRIRSIVRSRGWDWDTILDVNGDLARRMNIYSLPLWIGVNPEGRTIYQKQILSSTEVPIIFRKLAASDLERKIVIF